LPVPPNAASATILANDWADAVLQGRAGDNEQRPVAVLRGGELLGVELVKHGGALLGRSARTVPSAGDGQARVPGAPSPLAL